MVSMLSKNSRSGQVRSGQVRSGSYLKSLTFKSFTVVIHEVFLKTRNRELHFEEIKLILTRYILSPKCDYTSSGI